MDRSPFYHISSLSFINFLALSVSPFAQPVHIPELLPASDPNRSYCMISSLTSRPKVFRNCWVHQPTSCSRDTAPVTAIFPSRNQLGCKSSASHYGLVPCATPTSLARVPSACTAPRGSTAPSTDPSHLCLLLLLPASWCGRLYQRSICEWFFRVVKCRTRDLGNLLRQYKYL